MNDQPSDQFDPIGFEFDYGGHHLRIEERHPLRGYVAKATDVTPPWTGGWVFQCPHLLRIKQAIDAGQPYDQTL